VDPVPDLLLLRKSGSARNLSQYIKKKTQFWIQYERENWE
jgi:hypothetical protein